MELAPSAEIVAAGIETRLRNESYLWDPVAWAEDTFGIILWSKQKEIMRSVAANRKTAVKSCHSIGKTYLSALLTCWWVCTREDAIVQSTAPTYPQVHGLLWEEVRKLRARANLPGRITNEDEWKRMIKVGTGVTEGIVAVGKKPADSNIHGFHGVHRIDGVFAILDEGCGLVRAIFNGAEAITTFPGDRMLTVGNPDDPNTQFGDLWGNPSGEWNLITVSAFDTPWFPRRDGTREADELIAAAGDDAKKLRHTMDMLDHMPNLEIIESMGREWGVESATYKSKVLAEFPDAGSDSFFPQSVIDTSWDTEFEDDYDTPAVLGVDLAGWGDDESTIYINRGGKVRKLIQWAEGDATIGVENIVQAIKDTGAVEARIDGSGLGGPIFDFIVARDDIPLTCSLIKIMGTNASTDNLVYANARAEQYNSLRHMMRTGRIDLDIENDARLKKQLLAIKYSFNNKGAIIVESKRDMRSRGIKSPDELDAVVYATVDTDWLNNEILDGTVIEYNMDEEIAQNDGMYSWSW